MFKLEKIAEYGLYLLIFLLPLQTRWIIKEGLTDVTDISLYGTDILLILLLGVFVALGRERFKKNDQLKIPVAWYFIALFDAAAFISIFFAEDKILAGFFYGRIFLAIGLFLLLKEAKYSQIKLFFAFLTGAFLQAGLAIWQFLNQVTFANKWLGLAARKGSELGPSVIEVFRPGQDPERWLRAYGGFDHPNILGGFLAMAILLLIVKRDKILFSFWGVKLDNIIFFLFFGTFLFGLYFSFSRASWLGVVSGVGMLLFFSEFKKDLKIQKSLLEELAVAALLIMALLGVYGDLATTRFFGKTRLELKSTNERVVSYRDSWTIIKNNWLAGAGVGNYTLALQKNIPKQPYYFYQPVHNVFLLIWAEIGIFGLIGFLGILARLVFKIFTGHFGKYNFFSLIFLLSLIIFLLVDHWLFSLHFGIMFLFFVLFLVDQEDDGLEKVCCDEIGHGSIM